MNWLPRQRLRLIGLIASIGGGMAFSTAFAGIIWILWRGGWPAASVAQRIDWIGWGAMIMAGGSVMTVIGIGFVVTPRKFSIDRNGASLSGGDNQQEEP